SQPSVRLQCIFGPPHLDLAVLYSGLVPNLADGGGTTRTCPVQMSNREACQGHWTRLPGSSPSESGPPACEQVSLIAQTVSLFLKRRMGVSPAIALTSIPSVIRPSSSTFVNFSGTGCQA